MDSQTVSNSANTVSMISVWASLGGVFLSGLISALVARWTSLFSVRNEKGKRRAETALKISELLSNDDLNKREAARRRYAVGLIKVHSIEEEEDGLVHFIPMYSRITVGRSIANDVNI